MQVQQTNNEDHPYSFQVSGKERTLELQARCALLNLFTFYFILLNNPIHKLVKVLALSAILKLAALEQRVINQLSSLFFSSEQERDEWIKVRDFDTSLLMD